MGNQPINIEGNYPQIITDQGSYLLPTFGPNALGCVMLGSNPADAEWSSSFRFYEETGSFPGSWVNAVNGGGGAPSRTEWRTNDVPFGSLGLEYNGSDIRLMLKSQGAATLELQSTDPGYRSRWPSTAPTGGMALMALGDVDHSLTWQHFYGVCEDEGTTRPRRPVLNFVGAGVTVTDDPGNNRTTVTITGGGGSSGGFVATFDPCTGQAAGTIYGGGGPVGDMWFSVVVPGSSFQVNAMRCVCSAIGGAGEVRLGIYDSAGTLLAQTNGFTPVVGLNAQALIAPLTMTAGSIYYVGIWTNRNAAAFLSKTGSFNGAGSTLNFEAVNIVGVGGLPASVAGSISNKTTTPIYVSALT